MRISIHAAREGGDVLAHHMPSVLSISIHAAREGGDVLAHHMPSVLSISIHAAREGGDTAAATEIAQFSYFNPRRP